MSWTATRIDTRRSSVPRFSTFAAMFPKVSWCEGRDSNPHALRRQILSLVRLPIPPPSRGRFGRRSPKNQRIITTVAVRHYENFPVASLILPAPLREPVEVIYRFARSADDLADEGSDPPDIRLEKLNRYRVALDCIERGEPVEGGLFGDLARIVRSHALPVSLLRDLVDAFRQDVTKKRYA